jgi:hypothetical protein
MNMRTAGTCSGHSSKHFLFALGSVGLSTVVPRFASSRMIVLDLPTGTHPRHRRSATELTLMISLTAGLTTLTVFPRRLIAAFIVIVTVWMQGGELTNTARECQKLRGRSPLRSCSSIFQGWPGHCRMGRDSGRDPCFMVVGTLRRSGRTRILSFLRLRVPSRKLFGSEHSA